MVLLLAEGGTERGPRGDDRPIAIARRPVRGCAAQSDPEPPKQCARRAEHRHADLIELSDGTWAAVHLGVRPRGQSPSFHVNGRESFLVGIDWVDGWPAIDEARFVVPPVDHSFEDAFDEPDLHPRWLGVGRFPTSFTHPGADGGLIIDADAGSGEALLAARATDEVWTATTQIHGADAGTGRFLLRIDDQHWYGLTYDGATVEATLAIGPVQHTVGRWDVPSGTAPMLRISAKAARPMPHGVTREPDLIELSVTAGADEHSFGEFDGRYLSTEVAGGFTGRVFGVEALTGQIHVHDVEYHSPKSPTT